MEPLPNAFSMCSRGFQRLVLVHGILNDPQLDDCAIRFTPCCPVPVGPPAAVSAPPCYRCSNYVLFPFSAQAENRSPRTIDIAINHSDERRTYRNNKSCTDEYQKTANYSRITRLSGKPPAPLRERRRRRTGRGHGPVAPGRSGRKALRPGAAWEARWHIRRGSCRRRCCAGSCR